MTDTDLIRFLDAQDQIYDQVIDELAKGRKETHWRWFIFPQLACVDGSELARTFFTSAALVGAAMCSAC